MDYHKFLFLDKEIDLDFLQEFSGTNMYHSFQEGLPTRKELINFDKLSESEYFYEMEQKLDNLISIPSKNKASVFRSVKLLNEVLDTINNNFFPDEIILSNLFKFRCICNSR